VSDLDKVELLADSMPLKVGNPFSYKSFAEDLEVSDKTVKRWVKILDSLYYCFLIAPYGSTKIKAVKKSQKLYLWDWSQIADSGARFENMVASHLLKMCNYWEDTQGFRAELRYIRDQKGREVDFVVLRNRKPLFAVECKLNDTNISPSLIEMKSKLDIPKWYQVTFDAARRDIDEHFSILSFTEFCKEIDAV
jgi:predicted AAA+ superfamily ATPase